MGATRPLFYVQRYHKTVGTACDESERLFTGGRLLSYAHAISLTTSPIPPVKNRRYDRMFAAARTNYAPRWVGNPAVELLAHKPKRE